MRIKNEILGAFFLIGFLTVSIPSIAHSEEQGEENFASNELTKLDFGDQTMLSPVWEKILKDKEGLNEVVKSGNLETVHKYAFAISDLSKELLKRTTDKDLSEKQMSNVKTAVQRIGEIAVALDEYGDKKDQANTEKQLEKFNKLIDYIDMQYSESTNKDNKENKTMAVMYICPMHPEVQSDKPGNCPKCGMKLQPVAQDNSEKEGKAQRQHQ